VTEIGFLRFVHRVKDLLQVFPDHAVGGKPHDEIIILRAARFGGGAVAVHALEHGAAEEHRRVEEGILLRDDVLRDLLRKLPRAPYAGIVENAHAARGVGRAGREQKVHRPLDAVRVGNIVGVLPGDVCALRARKALVERSAETEICFVLEDRDARILRGNALHDAPCIVRGGVVAEDELQIAVRLRQNGRRRLFERGGAVIYAHENGNESGIAVGHFSPPPG